MNYTNDVTVELKLSRIDEKGFAVNYECKDPLSLYECIAMTAHFLANRFVDMAKSQNRGNSVLEMTGLIIDFIKTFESAYDKRRTLDADVAAEEVQ